MWNCLASGCYSETSDLSFTVYWSISVRLFFNIILLHIPRYRKRSVPFCLPDFRLTCSSHLVSPSTYPDDGNFSYFITEIVFIEEYRL